MKRYQVILLVFVGIVILLWIVARITGALQFHRIPTASMEPTLMVGQRIFTTNLKSPERNDIVVFTRLVNEKFETDPNGKKNAFCYRLIAKGGDKVEIKNGYAFVNGQIADDTTKLKFPYTLSPKNFNDLLTVLEIDESDLRYNNDFYSAGDESHAILSYNEFAKAKNVIPLVRVIMTTDNPAPNIYQGKNWTIDSFGPYLVPPGHFFVMGDNRHNAMDSRYVGPIPMKDIKGVLIGKF